MADIGNIWAGLGSQMLSQNPPINAEQNAQLEQHAQQLHQQAAAQQQQQLQAMMDRKERLASDTADNRIKALKIGMDMVDAGHDPDAINAAIDPITRPYGGSIPAGTWHAAAMAKQQNDIIDQQEKGFQFHSGPQAIPTGGIPVRGGGPGYFTAPPQIHVIPPGMGSDAQVARINPSTGELVGSTAIPDSGRIPPKAMTGPQLTGSDSNSLWAKDKLAHPESSTPEEISQAKQIEETSTLDPESVDFAVRSYFKTGKLPALGMGGAKVRTQILNQAGKTAALLGIQPEDVMASGAEYAANSGALNKLTQQQAGIQAYSNFTEGQLKLLGQTLDNMEKVIPQFQTSFANRAVRSWVKDVQGSPVQQAAVQQYGQQLSSVQSEVARLVSGGSGTNQMLPVDFLKQWQGVLYDGASPNRVRAFVEQAIKEKDVRTSSFDTTRQSIVDRLRKKADYGRVENFNSSGTVAPGDNQAQPQNFQHGKYSVTVH